MSHDSPEQHTSLSAPVFPYYLDEEMVMSFLATIEGGLSIVQKVSQTVENTEHRDKAGEIEVGGGFLSTFKASAKGGIGRSSNEISSESWEYERQYPIISLFNLLREQLFTLGISKSIVNDPSIPLSVGDIVEFEGSVQKNPFVELADILDTYFRMRPIFEKIGAIDRIPNAQPFSSGRHRGTQGKQTVQSGTANGGTVEEQAVKGIADEAAKGIAESGLLDVSIETGHDTFEKAVLTLRVERDPAQAIAFSRGSKCKVIGKITGLTEADEIIPLYRRSGLRMFPTSAMVELFQPLKNLSGVVMDFDDVAISGPAIQVLPLAIFV